MRKQRAQMCLNSKCIKGTGVDDLKIYIVKVVVTTLWVYLALG